MSIRKQDVGVHKDILVAEFGNGDIRFTRCTVRDHHDINLPPGVSLIFHNNPAAREIGAESDEDKGKNTNELETPEFILHFTKPESITALIHSLIEQQKALFDEQKLKQQ